MTGNTTATKSPWEWASDTAVCHFIAQIFFIYLARNIAVNRVQIRHFKYYFYKFRLVTTDKVK